MFILAFVVVGIHGLTQDIRQAHRTLFVRLTENKVKMLVPFWDKSVYDGIFLSDGHKSYILVLGWGVMAKQTCSSHHSSVTKVR